MYSYATETNDYDVSPISYSKLDTAQRRDMRIRCIVQIMMFLL